MPSSSPAFTFSQSATSAFASSATLPPALVFFMDRSRRFSTVSRSFRHSSVSMISLSRFGSMPPSTWVTFSSSKQRRTCSTASTCRMLARNWLPSPSPLDAPRTSPAMSTNSKEVGMTFCGFTFAASWSSRSSGTGTTPTFGSMVQNG